MAQELEPLNLKITGNANGLSAALGKAQGDISGFTSRISGSLQASSTRLGSGLDSMLGGFASLRAGPIVALGAALAGAAGYGVKLAAANADTELSFKALVGSAENAKRVLAELSEFASKTPFETPEVKDAAQALLTYGFTADQLQEQLKLIGNVAAVSGADFAELAKLVGRARSSNTLFTEDLNQFSDRAIPIIDELSKRFGVTGAEVRKLASEGKINFSDLQAVLEALGGEGGKFGKAMEERSKTLNGQLSTLMDNLKSIAKNIGEIFVPALTTITGGLNSVLEVVNKLSERLSKGLNKFFGVFIDEATESINNLLAFATDAYNAIAEATGLFPKIEPLKIDFDSDKTEAMAESFREIEKRSVDAAASLKEFKDQAESIKATLATPEEKYKSKLEELSQAVLKGGLDFEFFSRGVRAAYEELERFNQQQVESSRPKFATRGSKEAREILDKRALDAKVASQVQSEVDKLQRKIQQLEQEKRAKEASSIALPIADMKATLSSKLDGVIQAINNNKPVVRTANI